MNHLPSSIATVLSIDDLLMEILLRLPAQSILGFKSVSKHWYSLLTSPEFSLCHRKKPAAATGILFMHHKFGHSVIYEFAPLSIENPATPPFRKLQFTDDPSIGIRIKQSCNGLLLCSSSKQVPELGVVQYFVCNPTTKRFVTLPGLEAQESSSWSCIQGMSLAFDPAKSPHYKVVCVSIFPLVLDAQFQIEVYSSETKSCRRSGEVFGAEIDFGTLGVYWNGAIHWICNGYQDLCFYKVDVETLHTMPMPPLPTWHLKSSRRLVESCDHLHLIEAKHKSFGANFMFYEMKKDRSEWFVKYCIDLSPLVESYGKLSPLLSLVRRNKEDDDGYLVLSIMGKVVLYDLLKNTHQVCFDCESYIVKEEDEFKLYLQIDGPQYIESLCSV